MVPMNVDSSTIAVASAASATVTFAFCTLVMEIRAGHALIISAAIGFILFSMGIIPIGAFVLIGGGMIFAIIKTMILREENDQNQQTSPQQADVLERKQSPSDSEQTATANALSPHKCVADALQEINRQIELGTQVPVLLNRVFPLMPFAHAHQINTYYIKLRSEGHTKIDAITIALESYVESLDK
jgi:hypothetical protein